MSEGTDKVTSTRSVPCDPDKAYDRWINSVWIGGGGLGTPTIEEQGKNGGDDHMFGNLRCVTGGIREEILEASRSEHRIVYTVKSGPFPVSYHRACVTFVAEEVEGGGRSTLVTWHCDFTPQWFCPGPVVRAIISGALGRMLNVLEAECGRTLRSQLAELTVLEIQPSVYFYFSADWCPDCASVTPRIINFCEEHSAGQLISLFYVPSDRTEEEKQNSLSKIGAVTGAHSLKDLVAVEDTLATTLKKQTGCFAGSEQEKWPDVKRCHGIPSLFKLDAEGENLVLVKEW